MKFGTVASMTDALPPIRGRCLCAGVEIELTPPTDFVAHCHCQSCRLSHAAPFVTWTSVPAERFAIRAGEELISWYRSSALIEWGFCSRCGSSLLYRALGDGHPESPRVGAVYVSAASLIDPLDREPTAHVSYEERTPWIDPLARLPRYRGKGDELID